MEPRQIKILVVDADKPSALQCVDLLKSKGYQVDGVHSFDTALTRCSKAPYHLVITESIFPNRKSGSDLVQQIRDIHNQIGVILLTSNPTLEGAIDAMRLGVSDYLPKPVAEAKLLEAVNRSLTRQGIHHTSDETINKAIGARIRQIRHERGLTTQVIGNRVGVTQAQISQIETGRSAASVITLYKIAGVLEINMSEMLQGV